MEWNCGMELWMELLRNMGLNCGMERWDKNVGWNCGMELWDGTVDGTVENYVF